MPSAWWIPLGRHLRRGAHTRRCKPCRRALAGLVFIPPSVLPPNLPFCCLLLPICCWEARRRSRWAKRGWSARIQGESSVKAH